MSERGTKLPTLRKRRRCAWMAVALAIAAVLGICAASKGIESAPGISTGGKKIMAVWNNLESGASEQEVIAASGVELSTQSPAWFAQEIGVLSTCVAYADKDWNLVRLELTPQESARNGEEYLRRELASNGWTETKSNYEKVSTFVKSEGVCSWMMVEFVQTENECTSALMHLVHN